MPQIFESLFAIGEHCLFQPNLNKSDGKETDPYSSVECRIKSVTFSGVMVLYGIEVKYHESGKDYWLKIGDVDSILILPIT